MNAKRTTLFGLTALLAALLVGGCGRDKLTDTAQISTDPVVFDDTFGDGVDYQAFMGSKFDAVQMDSGNDPYAGTAHLRVTVPGPGAVDGTFAGGAFTTFNVRDLSQYNALTFYAKSSMNSTLDIAGLGNDNTGTSLYQSSLSAIPLTQDWVRVVVPIPNPSRLTEEAGLFFFAEGHENNMGFDFWMDEIKFEYVNGITNPRPRIDTETQTTFVGGVVEISGAQTTFEYLGEDLVIDHFPACFDYSSDDESVAIVEAGTITAVGSGTARITARLDTVDASGQVTVNVLGAPDGPAPAPTVDENDVISLFSDVYDDVPVNTWHAPWTGSTGEVRDFQIGGDNVKVYTDLNFAGIEFVGENMIDAATPGMTHLHLDVWAPSGGLFRVKLVDFGPNGQYDGGGDDSEHELTFNGGTVPPFFSGQWSPLEIPLADFTGLSSTSNLAQMVISSSDVNTVIVDNVYFHR